MDAIQNSTNANLSTSAKPVKYDITPQQQAWIEYKGMNGLVFDWNGEEYGQNSRGEKVGQGIPMKKMTTQEFANLLGVHRDTLYKWTNTIPDFWDRVAEARTRLSSRDRLAKVHETLYLKAVAGDKTLLPIWLANFDPNFRMPAQKIDHDVSDNLADLMKQLRSDRDQERHVVEAEVVNNQPEQQN